MTNETSAQPKIDNQGLNIQLRQFKTSSRLAHTIMMTPTDIGMASSTPIDTKRILSATPSSSPLYTVDVVSKE